MLKSQRFTSSGTFTPPAGVTAVFVTLVAGGGAGSWTVSDFSNGTAGSAGGMCSRKLVPVNGPVAVTLGAGGVGEARFTYGFQGNGGDSSFGSLVVSGGQGSFWTDPAHGAGGNSGNATGRIYTGGTLSPFGQEEGMCNYAGELLGVTGPGLPANKPGPMRFFNGATGGYYGRDSVNGHSKGADGIGGGGGATGGGAASPWGDGGAGGHDIVDDGDGYHATGFGAGGGAACHLGIGGSGSGGLCLVEWMAPA